MKIRFGQNDYLDTNAEDKTGDYNVVTELPADIKEGAMIYLSADDSGNTKGQYVAQTVDVTEDVFVYGTAGCIHYANENDSWLVKYANDDAILMINNNVFKYKGYAYPMPEAGKFGFIGDEFVVEYGYDGHSFNIYPRKGYNLEKADEAGDHRTFTDIEVWDIDQQYNTEKTLQIPAGTELKWVAVTPNTGASLKIGNTTITEAQLGQLLDMLS